MGVIDINNKIIPTIIAVIIIFAFGLFSLNSSVGDSNIDNVTNTTINPEDIVEDGEYITKEEVSIYIKKFHELPNNFITKDEAHKLGWEGGPLKEYAPGKSIGGDIFTNRQSILPSGHKYIECDIEANGTKRGPKRLVYSTDEYKTYYTDDHYETFKEI